MKKLIATGLALALACSTMMATPVFAKTIPSDYVGKFVDSDGYLATDSSDTIRPGYDYYYVIGKSSDYGLLTNEDYIRFSSKKQDGSKYVKTIDLVEKKFGGTRYVCVLVNVKDDYTDNEYKVSIDANFRAKKDLWVQSTNAAGFPKFVNYEVDGSGNPISRSLSLSVNEAQSAVNSAQSKLDEVKRQVEAAKKAMDDAQKAYNGAKAAEDNAQKAYKAKADSMGAQTQTSLELLQKDAAAKKKAYEDARANALLSLDQDVTTAQNALSEAQTAQQTAQANLDTANARLQAAIALQTALNATNNTDPANPVPLYGDGAALYKDVVTAGSALANAVASYQAYDASFTIGETTKISDVKGYANGQYGVGADGVATGAAVTAQTDAAAKLEAAKAETALKQTALNQANAARNSFQDTPDLLALKSTYEAAQNLVAEAQKQGRAATDAQQELARLEQAYKDAAAKTVLMKKNLDDKTAAYNRLAVGNTSDLSIAQNNLKVAQENLKIVQNQYQVGSNPSLGTGHKLAAGETYTSTLKFYVANKSVTDDDTTFVAGEKGVVVKPVRNELNTVTWEDSNRTLAMMTFRADSDVSFYCPRLSTSWNSKDYDEYFYHVDAYVFNWVSSPAIPSTSRPTLDLYNPFVDSDGELTERLKDLYLYEVIDGDLVDITDSSNVTFTTNDDGDEIIRIKTRTLGTYIVTNGEADIDYDDDDYDYDEPTTNTPGNSSNQIQTTIKPNPGTGR